jgi:RNA-directed DNA polymerase
MGSRYAASMSGPNYFDGLTWDQVVWSTSYEKVRRMQRRIFKASRLGETKRMWFLQKLLLRSPHAKLVAVHMVTTTKPQESTLARLNNTRAQSAQSNSTIPDRAVYNRATRARELRGTRGLRGEKTTSRNRRSRGLCGIDKNVVSSPEDKLTLARNLRLNGKASVISKSWIPKPGKCERNLLPRVSKKRGGKGIPTIQDRAKQALCKLVLEPEWEAKFEPNSYGFRPGRCPQDAIEEIYQNLCHGVDKYVFYADIHMCLDNIDHDVFLSKLNTFPLMQYQVAAWLKAGVFDEYVRGPAEPSPASVIPHINLLESGPPQGTVILPLLINIALHGLEKHLLSKVVSSKNSSCRPPNADVNKRSPEILVNPAFLRNAGGSVAQLKPPHDPLVWEHPRARSARAAFEPGAFRHPGSSTGRVSLKRGVKENVSQEMQAKNYALCVVRYADNFVIIHKDVEVMHKIIVETRQWLSGIGLDISQEKSFLKRASESFNFLGFKITCVRVQNKYRVKITPSKESVLRLFEKVRRIIRFKKAASAYELISILRPILLGWANYFQFCECKDTFSRVDHYVFQQLRAWVFRRAIRQNRSTVKESYFPSNQIYAFQGRKYRANWILVGKKKNKEDLPSINYLPKISWIKRKKFIKVKSDVSVYDGNEIYWALRDPHYSSFSTRIKNLLIRQDGKCARCKTAFRTGDFFELDGPSRFFETRNITSKSKGGRDDCRYLQLLHRQCQIDKIA